MNISVIRFEYFNECQNVYIDAVGDDLIPKFENTIPVEEGGTIHWGVNEHGIVNFGLWRDDPKKRPEHGGMWSSRAGVVGPLIDRKMVDVGINGFAAHITVESLEKSFLMNMKLGNGIRTGKPCMKYKGKTTGITFLPQGQRH